MTAPAKTDEKPQTSEMRVPATMRLKMSRPRHQRQTNARPKDFIQTVVVEEVFRIKRRDHGADNGDDDQKEDESGSAIATGCFLNLRQNSPIGVRSASLDLAMRGSTAVSVLIYSLRFFFYL